MWILLTVAAAGELDCRRCCEAQGAGECEISLRVYGPESRLSQDRGGWRVDGVYVIGCDGRGWFDNSKVAYLMREPVDGELAMPESDPAALDCFQRACAMPRDLALSAADAAGTRVVRSSTTGLPPDRMAYRRAPSTPSPAEAARTPAAVPPAATNTIVTGSSAAVVVIEGRTIYAQRAPGSTSPAVRPVVDPAADPEPPVRITTTAPVVQVASVAPATTASPPPAPGPDPFTIGLPPDPPAECYTAEGDRGTAARAQVMAGDDMRIARDLLGAVSAYRAAITLDVCSAYGWLGMGQSALALQRPDIAARALRNATRLMPTHYGAWTELGRAYEGIQQLALAHAAFEEALARKADLPDANAGWRRTLPR